MINRIELLNTLTKYETSMCETKHTAQKAGDYRMEYKMFACQKELRNVKNMILQKTQGTYWLERDTIKNNNMVDEKPIIESISKSIDGLNNDIALLSRREDVDIIDEYNRRVFLLQAIISQIEAMRDKVADAK